MTTTPAKPRPLSPHLGIYKPQITTVMSITNRVTGIALALGLPAFVVWLALIASGPAAYASFLDICRTKTAQVFLIGWTFSFFYHFWNGIRHLCWDAGWFLDMPAVRWTGWLALFLTLSGTIVIWLKIWGYIPT
ncbi:MAG: succinate dehydrogenase, cytochrome b556 subunit [Pseudomonadota bacterium]|nr:succinate dehydrogenase, cytochrome b556 subunit [Pseudomonadota bacterium]